MNKWIKLLIVIAVIYMAKQVFFGPSEPTNPEDKYETSWQSPGKELGPIAIALGKSNILGCGEFHVKEANSGNGEYLIACSRDGENWTYYLVWIPSEKVMGPLSDSLSKPY